MQNFTNLEVEHKILQPSMANSFRMRFPEKCQSSFPVVTVNRLDLYIITHIQLCRHKVT